MKVFILEDDPRRQVLFWESSVGHCVTLAVDRAEAEKKFQPPYDVLLLDHDLGGEAYVDSANANTGAGFCRWLVETQAAPTNVVIHSFNPTGAREMQRILHEAGWPAVARLPFGGVLLQGLAAAGEAEQKKKADPTA